MIPRARGGSYATDFSGTSASSPYVAGARGYTNPFSLAYPFRGACGLMSWDLLLLVACDGKGHGYFDFTRDPDSFREPLLYWVTLIQVHLWS